MSRWRMDIITHSRCKVVGNGKSIHNNARFEILAGHIGVVYCPYCGEKYGLTRRNEE